MVKLNVITFKMNEYFNSKRFITHMAKNKERYDAPYCVQL